MKKIVINQIMNRMNLQQVCRRMLTAGFKVGLTVSLAVALVLFSVNEGSTVLGGDALAYSIDYGMDQARGEKTIEYYGEYLRDLIEQTLRNNEDHPDSKSTAKNTYRRESYLNNVLPKQRSTAFSKEDLLKLRRTENPKDKLKK
jgi:hypothetical protein